MEPGNIIVRQRGQKVGIVASTRTVAFGRDWTVYALQPGVVKYWRDGARGGKSVVEVVRAPDVAATFAVEAELDAERVDAPAGASGGRTGSGRRAVAPVERYPLVRVRWRSSAALDTEQVILTQIRSLLSSRFPGRAVGACGTRARGGPCCGRRP